MFMSHTNALVGDKWSQWESGVDCFSRQTVGEIARPIALRILSTPPFIFRAAVPSFCAVLFDGRSHRFVATADPITQQAISTNLRRSPPYRNAGCRPPPATGGGNGAASRQGVGADF